VWKQLLLVLLLLLVLMLLVLLLVLLLLLMLLLMLLLVVLLPLVRALHVAFFATDGYGWNLGMWLPLKGPSHLEGSEARLFYSVRGHTGGVAEK